MALRTSIARSVVAGLVGATAGATSCSPSATQAQASSDDEVTFTKTIEPIVQDKCQACHREGGIAPFSLTSYEQVKAMGQLAKDKVARREMPPWAAFDDESCTVRRAFKDDLSMTEEQIDTFVRWVDAGMPLGDPTKRVPPKTFGSESLLDKTRTLSLAEPYALPAGGDDEVRCFPLDPGFTEDTWVGGTNLVPGDPSVVHHAIVFIDPDRRGAELAEGKASYPCFGGPRLERQSILLAWAPGVRPTSYADGVGLRVPKGAHLVMQMHYHPGPEAAVDRTTIELTTLPSPPRLLAEILLIGNADGGSDGVTRLLPGPSDPPSGPLFVIPSNAKGHTETMEAVMPERNGFLPVPSLAVYAVGAHMHWAGVDMEIEIERKKPTEDQPAKECLLGTPRYDFNWQRHYVYDAPLDQLPIINPGDKLRFRCTYDNTTDNPHIVRAMAERRMSRPPELRLGETSFDEMCQGVLVVLAETSLKE